LTSPDHNADNDFGGSTSRGTARDYQRLDRDINLDSRGFYVPRRTRSPLDYGYGRYRRRSPPRRMSYYYGSYDYDRDNYDIPGSLPYHISHLIGTSYSNPATSALAIMEASEGFAKSGAYYISFPGMDPFLLYCDLETDGGGWMLVSKFSCYDTYDDEFIIEGNYGSTRDLSHRSVDYNAWLSREIISTGEIFRITSEVGYKFFWTGIPFYNTYRHPSKPKAEDIRIKLNHSDEWVPASQIIYDTDNEKQGLQLSGDNVSISCTYTRIDFNSTGDEKIFYPGNHSSFVWMK